MKKAIFLLCCCTLPFSPFTLSAQQVNLDSLYTLWQDKTQPDSVRVTAYNDYIWAGYLYSNPDSAAVLAEALHSYAQKHNYPKAAATAYNLQGSVSYIKGNYPRALEYYQKSLAIREEIGDKVSIAGSLNNIGNIYHSQGNNPRALEYYQKALAMNEEIGDKKGIASSLNNIGLIYYNQDNYPRALEYYNKSLAIREELGDKRGIGHSLNNIGLIYENQGNYPRALEYYEKSLAMDEELGEKRGIASSLNTIGNFYGKQGNYPLALGYCQKGLDLAEGIGSLDRQKHALQCLYDTYKAMGKGNEALVYLEKLRVVEDSLNDQETAKKLEQMEFAKVMLQDSIAKVEEARLVEEAHREEVSQRKRRQNIFMYSGLAFFVLAGGLYSRVRYIRKSRDIIAKEKDRSDHLLLNILPAEIAAELKEKGRANARDFDMVSILFTDFKSFTETSAKLSAAALVNEINTCFEAFDGIIEKFGIEKIKTIGDSYMAAGGLPVPTDDSVRKTVLAALEMQEFIIARGQQQKAKSLPFFEMRIGIHTGPVVAGIVGVKKFQYDIWGDTVNTASRMESHGEAGKVNISQSTYELIKNDPQFQFQPRGKVQVKGKGEVEMYFVQVVNALTS